ncbi:hypothetical protein J6590_035134 [Homalodisca vitripennis]|nr:hypothetical protein J6590_035134 [Homalodisca vitripennis]
MIGLCGIWGGLANRRFEDHKPSIRTHFVSSCDLRRPEVSSENFESPLGSSGRLSRRRSPSLPPIYKHYQIIIVGGGESPINKRRLRGETCNQSGNLDTWIICLLSGERSRTHPLTFSPTTPSKSYPCNT